MPTSALKNTAAPTDAVAIAAYLDWLAAGKPPGRDDEFWLKAEGRLAHSQPKPAKSGARKAPAEKSK